RGLRVPLGGWKGPALAFIGLLVGTALVAPVSVLLFWAIRGFVRGSLGTPALATLVRGLLRPAANTAWASVAAAVAAILAVAPAAFLTVRHKSVSGGLSNAVIVGGFALPGLTIALALAFWSVRAPGLVGVAYQGPALLIFAYVVHFGAQALRASQVAVAGVPLRVGEAARVLGARRVRRLISIDLPLMTPGILAGGGLVLLSVMKELPATLLLAPAGFQTLATKIWTAAEDGFLADASIASLVLIALSGVLTWLLVIRRWFRE
ncbi:MAG: ABC transporter permease, partial [Candidatus Methylomirabilales bacterium]